MARDIFTDEQVELEIDRLLRSDAVKLARKEIAIKNKRRQYMYHLRNMEKRGNKLKSDGFTLDNIESRLLGDIEEV